MAAPTWLTAIFAALMLIVAAYCATRLFAAPRRHRPTHLDTDTAHILMGTAMAGMLISRLRILPPTAWEAVFAIAAAWFAYQTLRSRRRTPSTPWRCQHPTPHLIECAAMLYMFAAPPTTTAGMPMSASGSHYSFLALPMALFMFVYVAQVGDRLTAPALAATSSPSANLPPQPERPHLAPRCAALCKIAMALTMAYMLVLML